MPETTPNEPLRFGRWFGDPVRRTADYLLGVSNQAVGLRIDIQTATALIRKREPEAASEQLLALEAASRELRAKLREWEEHIPAPNTPVIHADKQP